MKRKNNYINRKAGFTLIELLIVIAIIGIVTTISIFGLQGAREQSRDTKRKSDLEQIRSALELYRADCGRYPNTLPAVDGSLTGGSTYFGTGTMPSSCVTDNSYIKIPGDPVDGSAYGYIPQSNNRAYTLCSGTESTSPLASPNPCSSVTCYSDCGYYVNNP